MGKFSRLLKRFTELSRLQSYWRSRGQLEAMRGAYMAVATLTSAVLAIAVLALTNSYALASFTATTSLGLLLPSSIWLASIRWKRRYGKVLANDDDFNWRMYLEDEFEDRIRRIENLGLDKPETDKLKLQAYQEFQAVLVQFQVSIASTPRQLPPQSINEAQAILDEIRRAPLEPETVDLKLNQLQERTRNRMQLGA